jgi:hypothetical protein
VIRLLVLLLLFADPWAAVRELKPGGDVRIYQTGEKKPVAAKFDSASEDALVILLKNGQVSIPKSRIERIEYRAPQPGRVSMETRRVVGTKEEAVQGRTKNSEAPPDSTSGGLKIVSRPFETVYRR